jgi:subtilase family serine protease
VKNILALSALVSVSASAAAVPSVIAARPLLPGHVPAIVSQLRPMGDLPGETNLNLAIGLPLRNREALTNLLEQLYDPGSSNFRDYLTPEQFAEQFGPTLEQYRDVIDFARRNGFTVRATHPNRMLLDVRGNAANIKNAFQVTLRLYQHPTEARAFYAPDTEPSVEPGIPALDVSGLSNYRRPHPKNLKVKPLDMRPTPKVGSGPNGTYMGKDFRAVYVRGTPLTGAGQAIGLVEFDGYYTADVTGYLSQAGQANVPLQNVLLDGFDGIPTTGPNSGNSEVALDIELAAAMAPGVSKIIVYESDPFYGIANDVISRMATDNLAAQLSCSWDFGSAPSATTEQIFQQFAAQGQSFFNASGDFGAYSNSAPIAVPDADPYITIVGGTTLTSSGPGGAWVSETAWNAGGGIASGGGYDFTVPLPVWQQGISMTANHGSTSARNIPDISMVADNIFIIADNGQSETITGTSASAPLWAGMTALMNQKAASAGHGSIGFINPAIYSLAKGPNYSTYFHDITTGNNTNSGSANAYLAVPGFDLCTGWGTPLGLNLINALALPDGMGVLPAGGFSANGPVGGPFTVSSQTFFLTNSGATSFDWSLGGGTAWLSVVPSAGTLAAGTGTNVTVSLNAGASSLTAGNFTANLGFTNLTSQSVQTRHISLSVGSSLVLNGGFESGDFAYWTCTGAASVNFVDDGTSSTVSPRSGNYVAALGQQLSLGALYQNLPTRAGQGYWLSLWFTATTDSSGFATPNVFRVQWNGKNLFAAANVPDSGWTNMQFIVTASAASTVLQFLFQDDSSAYLGLDDVSALPIPTPVIQPVSLSNNSIQLTWNSLAGLAYRVQYKTDFNQTTWTNLGSAVTATGPMTTASDTLTASSARYYRILVQLSQ